MSTPMIIAILSGVLLLCLGGYTVFETVRREQKSKKTKARRLAVDTNIAARSTKSEPEIDEDEKVQDYASDLANYALKMATNGDKVKIARIRKMLIRAGEFDPAATANFVLRRFYMLAGGAALSVGYCIFSSISLLTPKAVMIVGAASIVGYFIPSLMLMQKTKKTTVEYRNGFPDFMDLMIVCADAGLSLEASVDRVARELAITYPNLAHNLTAFGLELRAGRNIHDAMKSFGDRVNLEEVDAFAVLLKQSKELGTSLSGTLRVFSEEMRDKRMSVAEEKAHALPAKMTIPVTVCILPTVVMIAIIPIIVKLGGE